MSLTFVPIDEQGAEITKTEALFCSAFPEEERPPFEWMMRWKHDTFYAVYEENTFKGLVDLLLYGDLVYVFFLAISPEFQNQGIGSKVLAEILARYPKERVFLLADEAGEQYADNALRKRRLGFYGRNGFRDSGIKVVEFGVRYDMLIARGEVSKEEFRLVMQDLIGVEMAQKYYANI